ncbi:MAG: hypothetical protein SVG88_01870 [Halobacteriales archaeon]|nr:hypothetical protein [Halobacteriales archaeon]
MACDATDEQAGTTTERVDPMSLRWVGPATADCILAAPFDAADILHKRVSFVELIEAGINRGVAHQLRREYSLVWSFRWRPGSDLERRADQVRGLTDAERVWVADSSRPPPESMAAGEPNGSVDGATDGRWPEQRWAERILAAHDDDICDRCGADLEQYELGENVTRYCRNCGFVGISVDHRPEPAETESWEVALRRYLGDDR